MSVWFPGGSVVTNPPAIARDTRDTGSIPGWEDLLGKEMATHSSILAWEIPWTEEPGGLLPMGWQKNWIQFSNPELLKLCGKYVYMYF